MSRYILRRLLQAIPTLFGVSVLSFLIMTASPGGPTAALVLDPKTTPEKRAILNQQLGLNDPWPVQYVRWLIGDDWRQFDMGNGKMQYGTRRGILRGDFGYSFSNRRSVTALISERIGATLELSVISLIIGSTIGVAIGILAAVGRGGLFDNLTRVFSVVLSAIPVFWLGLMLILIFNSWLKILPPGGRCDPTTPCPPVYQRLEYLILPTFILSTGAIAGYSRYMRASMLDVVNQDYIRTAKSKGLPENTVWFLHAARNALIPLATFLGPAITGLLGGAVITETLFSWPGLGRLAITALNSLDYPLIMAIVMIGAVETVLGFVLSDILYAWVDPRIRFS